MTINDDTHFRKIGALAPSSNFLAVAMTKYVEEYCDAKSILEVGAGTGAITKTLAKRMSRWQYADVVEIYPELSALLKWRFSHFAGINIHCSDILQFIPQVEYDVIISSLPLNAFTPSKTSAIIDRLVALAAQNAVVSFFEYKILQKFAPLFLAKNKLADFYESRRCIENFVNKFKFDEAVIRLNIPPAVVHYLRIKKPDVSIIAKE